MLSGTNAAILDQDRIGASSISDGIVDHMPLPTEDS